MRPALNALNEDKRPIRAKRAQERSRETCRKIVKAGLKLWSERGFEVGFDATRVEEIAELAGISRGTVYYYFPKKEDILRELAWITAEEIHEYALRAIESGQSVDAALDEILQELGAKVSKAERAAVRRMLQVRSDDPESVKRSFAAGGLMRAFSSVISRARENGELPQHVNVGELAEILSSLCMGAIAKWTIVDDIDLPGALRRSGAFALAGARHFDKA